MKIHEYQAKAIKELIWSNSGHGISGTDPHQFVDVMVNHVLKQTWPGR